MLYNPGTKKPDSWSFVNPEDWSKYTPPKKKKVLYEYIVRHNSSNTWTIYGNLLEAGDIENHLPKYCYKKTGRSFEVEDT